MKFNVRIPETTYRNQTIDVQFPHYFGRFDNDHSGLGYSEQVGRLTADGVVVIFEEIDGNKFEVSFERIDIMTDQLREYVAGSFFQPSTEEAFNTMGRKIIGLVPGFML